MFSAPHSKLHLEDIKANVYAKALFSLSISTLDTLPSGQASNTLTNTANVLQVGISEKLGIFLQFTALMIAAIIIAFNYSWSLTLATSSLLLFIGLVYGVTIPIVVKRWVLGGEPLFLIWPVL
jgi:ATP-binding cassette subfamily B (MDR/TAP) protein 1